MKIYLLIPMMALMIIVLLLMVAMINDYCQPEIIVTEVNASLLEDGQFVFEYVLKNIGNAATGPVFTEYQFGLDYEMSFGGRDYIWFLDKGEKAHLQVFQYTKLYPEESFQFELTNIGWNRVSLKDRKFIRSQRKYGKALSDEKIIK